MQQFPMPFYLFFKPMNYLNSSAFVSFFLLFFLMYELKVKNQKVKGQKQKILERIGVCKQENLELETLA